MSGARFILLPGAGGDSWYWHLLAPRLEALGHEAVSVQLPAADERAGLPEYADAVLEAVGTADAGNLILVAQSLGGFTAPLVCERLAVRVLVFINAMIPDPGERPGEWFARTRQAEAKRAQNVRDGRAPDAKFDPLLEFFHDVPQSVTDQAWARGEPKQSDRIFSSPCAFSAWPSIPIHVVVGSEDRLFPAEFQRRVAHERLGVEADRLPGGHLIALSQPERLATQLASYAPVA
jgi:pimeloyl-ACP methyl ester carboxylesterase